MRVSTPALDAVLAWHAALNAGDTDRLLALSSDDVEVGGPRGVGRGGHLLREWVARAAIHLEPGRVFEQAGTVVVEESARWRATESGEMGAPQTVASVFRVRDGRVASVIRHADLTAALQAAGFEDAVR